MALDLLLPESESKDIIQSINNTIHAIECETCKITTGAARFALGNPVSFALLVEIGKIGCRIVIPFVGYMPHTCPGIIES